MDANETCERLREKAKQLRGHMDETSRLLSDAADVIEEMNVAVGCLHSYVDGEFPEVGENRRLQDENAKLREYVNAMAIQSYKGKMFDCGYCPFFNQCYNSEPKEHQGRGCQWWLWACELGVEVE